MDRRQSLATAAVASLGAAKARHSVAERAACSSLAQRMQPLETAAARIAGIGCRFVDVSCMGWAPHADVEALLGNFEREQHLGLASAGGNPVELQVLTAEHDLAPWAPGPGLVSGRGVGEVGASTGLTRWTGEMARCVWQANPGADYWTGWPTSGYGPLPKGGAAWKR